MALGSIPASFDAQRYSAALSGNALRDTQAVAAGLHQLHAQGLLDLPLLGRGRTRARFEALAEIAAIDLSLVRLVEGHVDALAILAEVSAPARAGCYGVWAAEACAPVTATLLNGEYVLSGRKRYASGASGLDRALVTAKAADGPRLFDVDLRDPRVRRVPGTWDAVGMAGSDSLEVWFDGVCVPAAWAVGAVGSYLERPSFWHGGVQVAACWYGGALGCARLLQRAYTDKAPDEHASAHIGQVYIHCQVLRQVLERAADEIDAAPGCSMEVARRRALLVRSAVEQGATAILEHTHRALGPSAMVFDAQHARRAADLPVYLRQHHGERDLAALGRSVLAERWP